MQISLLAAGVERRSHVSAMSNAETDESCPVVLNERSEFRNHQDEPSRVHKSLDHNTDVLWSLRCDLLVLILLFELVCNRIY